MREIRRIESEKQRRRRSVIMMRKKRRRNGKEREGKRRDGMRVVCLGEEVARSCSLTQDLLVLLLISMKRPAYLPASPHLTLPASNPNNAVLLTCPICLTIVFACLVLPASPYLRVCVPL